MGKYFSLSSVSPEMQDKLKSNSMDFGANMIAGKSSTVFKKESPKDNAFGSAVKADISSFGLTNAMMLADGVTEGLSPELGTIMARSISGESLSEIGSDLYDDYTNMGATMVGNIVSDATIGIENVYGSAMTTINNAPDFAVELMSNIYDDMSNMLITYTVNAVEHMLTMPTIGDISQRATQLLPTYLQSTSDLLKELTSNNEDVMLDLQEEQKNNKLNSFVNNTKDKIGNAKKSVDDTLKTFNTYLNTVASYIQQGPEWVTEQVDIYECWALEQVQTQIGIASKAVDKQKGQMVDNLAANIARGLAAPINAKAKILLQKQLNKTDEVKVKSITKAKAAISTAIMKILAKIGG